MKEFHRFVWHVHRKIKLSNGEIGNIFCAEGIHNKDYLKHEDNTQYSINHLVKGQGDFIGPKGAVINLSNNTIFHRPKKVNHKTIIDRSHGDWTEQFVTMTPNIYKTLSFLGFIPSTYPLVFSKNCTEIFIESFQNLTNCIKRYENKPHYDQEILLSLFTLCQKLSKKSFSETTIPKQYTKIVKDACSILDEDLLSELKLTDLAIDLGINYNTLRKHFSIIQGCSLIEYRINNRIKYAKKLLTEGYTITKVADSLNYSSPFAFSKQFKEHTGISPSMFTSISY